MQLCCILTCCTKRKKLLLCDPDNRCRKEAVDDTEIPRLNFESLLIRPEQENRIILCHLNPLKKPFIL